MSLAFFSRLFTLLVYGGKDVDLVEEVGPHEGVVALFMVSWNATVFVHVESHDIAEGYFAVLIKLDQVSVHAKWRASCRASEHEGALRGGFCLVDACSYIVCRPSRHIIIVLLNNKSHGFEVEFDYL